MIHSLIRFKNKHPFLSVMAIGMILRFISVVFSGGYTSFDDHFAVVELAQYWVWDIHNLSSFPPNIASEAVQANGFFYSGFHFLFFHLFQFVGIYDPFWKLVLVRLFHAGISLFVISFGYRIGSLITTKETAYRIALLLAVYWFMPFLSVRVMAEMAGLPFLLYGTLIIVRQEQIRLGQQPGYHKTSFVVAGFLLGLAFSVHYPILIFILGLALALLIAGNTRGLASAGLGFLAPFLLVEGFADWLIWRRPFYHLTHFFSYIIDHAHSYTGDSWYYFASDLLILLLPPLSLMLLWGLLRNWKKNFLLFLPVFLFMTVYLILPYNSHRPLIAMLPFFIVLGMAGWQEYAETLNLWNKHPFIRKVVWGFIWGVNMLLLLTVTPLYPNKASVEAMKYLKNFPENKLLVVEANQSENDIVVPVFFSGKQIEYIAINTQNGMNQVPAHTFKMQEDIIVLFKGASSLDMRVDSMKTVFPDLQLEAKFTPGLIERFFHRAIGSHHRVEIFLYRNISSQP